MCGIRIPYIIMNLRNSYVENPYTVDCGGGIINKNS
jgi:hypothetical protein